MITATDVKFHQSFTCKHATISGYCLTEDHSLSGRPFILQRTDWDGRPAAVINDYATLDEALAFINEETSRIRLEVSVCDARRSYFVTFEGPDAEAMALEYMDRTLADDKANGYQWGNRNFHEVEGYPYDAEKFARLFERMHPICEHGLSLNLCYGPGHYAQ